ncbi:MAG: hypothetical protein HC887_11355 [Desulfobacteraceae bacterium]|nr:hypothetical protein [Desulfobacteraceae bacterium]
MLKSDEQENIEKIESVGTPLCQLCDIRVGIATLKDELYFIDSRSEKNGHFFKLIDNHLFEIEKKSLGAFIRFQTFELRSNAV